MKKNVQQILAISVSLVIAIVIGYLSNPYTPTQLWERVQGFLPQVGVFLGVAVVIYQAMKFLLPKSGDTMRDAIDLKKKQGIKSLIGSLVLVIIAGPLVEELLFRLPLLIMFSQLNTATWVAIGISALAFSLIHVPELGMYDRHREMMQDKKNLELSPEEFGQIKFQQGPVKQKVVTIIVRILTALTSGLISGYLAIHSQSLWPAIRFHALWNIGAIIVVPLLTFVIGLIFYLVVSVLDTIKIRHWLDKNITNF